MLKVRVFHFYKLNITREHYKGILVLYLPYSTSSEKRMQIFSTTSSSSFMLLKTEREYKTVEVLLHQVIFLATYLAVIYFRKKIAGKIA